MTLERGLGSISKTFFYLLLSIALGVIALSANAQSISKEDKELLEQYFDIKSKYVLHLALNPVMVKAVRLQNRSKLTLKQIKQRDQAWSNSKDVTQFKRSLMTSDAGKLIQKAVEGNPAFTEAFLTDNQGANVAVFPPTSDYWQGDEDKWYESFNDGNGEYFFGELELDESTGKYQKQVSVPVFQRGETIGVLVVGVASDFLAAN